MDIKIQILGPDMHNWDIRTTDKEEAKEWIWNRLCDLKKNKGTATQVQISQFFIHGKDNEPL